MSRINLYAEELTDEIVVVSKTVDDDEFGKRIFYGIRMMLKSPPELHHSVEDDDRSAITFWVRSNRQGDADMSMLMSISVEFQKAILEIRRRIEAEG